MTFILSIGSDVDILNRRSAVLAEAGYAIISVVDLRKAAEKIANEEFDVVVLCSSLGEEDCRQLVNMSRRHRPFMPVVFIPGGAAESDVVTLVLGSMGETPKASSHVA
jgi:DNA-binding response OmpR family regulator